MVSKHFPSFLSDQFVPFHVVDAHETRCGGGSHASTCSKVQSVHIGYCGMKAILYVEKYKKWVGLADTSANLHAMWTSVAVEADISVRSPRKLDIFFSRKNIFCVKVS